MIIVSGCDMPCVKYARRDGKESEVSEGELIFDACKKTLEDGAMDEWSVKDGT